MIVELRMSGIFQSMKEYSSPAIEKVSLPEVMQALSDPCRIAIVRAILEKGELACNEVPLKVAKATRSHHFTILREAGLLSTRTAGTKCLSSIRTEEINTRFPGLLDLVVHHGKPTKPKKLKK